MGAGRGPARPARGARAAGGGSSPRPRPAALRADARLAFHLLPRRGGDHGRRPRGDARLRACGCRPAATRISRTSGCSPRPTGAWSSTSTTSTRRFPGPGSGTSSGSLRASRSPAGTAPSAPSSGARSCSGAASRLSRDHAPARRAQQPGRLVPARRHRPDPRSGSAARCGKEEREQVREERRQGEAQGPDARVREADRAGRRQAADQQRAAGARAARGDVQRQSSSRGPRPASTSVLEEYRATLLADRRHLLERLRLRARGPQGGRSGQRRHAGLDRAARRARRRRIRSSSR